MLGAMEQYPPRDGQAAWPGLLPPGERIKRVLGYSGV